jgi:hypothetical protein
MMNPVEMMKAAQEFKRFQMDHPRVVSFFQYVMAGGVPEGSVIEISVTKPGEKTLTTNLKVLAEDVEMIEHLKNLKG